MICSSFGLWWAQRQLKSRNHSTRLRAVEKMVSAQAFGQLEALIKHDDITVRRNVTDALYTAMGPQSADLLIVALKDPDSGVRVAAAEALGKIKDPRSVKPLIPALLDGSNDVRRSAAASLEMIDPNWTQSEAAGRSVPALIAALKDTDSEMRSHAAQVLGKIKDPRSVRPLITALLDVNIDVRQSAAEALEAIDPNWAQSESAGRAVSALIAVLKDSDGEVRGHAAQVLGKIKDPRSVKPLITVLLDVNIDVRQSAAEALETIDPNWPRSEAAVQTLPVLMEALRNADRELRRLAIQTLGKIENPRSVTQLISALLDGDIRMRQSAAEALETIDPNWPQSEAAVQALPTVLKALKGHDGDVRRRAAQVLGKLGRMSDPRWVKPLISALMDNDRSVRQSAVKTLEAIDPDWAQSETASRVVSTLVAALKDNKLRHGAGAALLEISAPQSVELLISALTANDGGARCAAAGLLGKMGNPRAVEPLIATLMDDASETIPAAVEALEAIDPDWAGSDSASRAVPNLLAALKGPDSVVRRAAALALGRIKDPRAFEPLIPLLMDDNILVRQCVAESLEAIDPDWARSEPASRAVPTLVAALGHMDVRPIAVKALINTNHEQEIHELISALMDSGIHGVAVDWVRTGAASRSVPTLVAALRNKKVTHVAVKMLRLIGDTPIREYLNRYKDEKKALVEKMGLALKRAGDFEEHFSVLESEWSEIQATADSLNAIQDTFTLEPLIDDLKSLCHLVTDRLYRFLNAIDCDGEAPGTGSGKEYRGVAYVHLPLDFLTRVGAVPQLIELTKNPYIAGRAVEYLERLVADHGSGLSDDELRQISELKSQHISQSFRMYQSQADFRGQLTFGPVRTTGLLDRVTKDLTRRREQLFQEFKASLSEAEYLGLPDPVVLVNALRHERRDVRRLAAKVLNRLDRDWMRSEDAQTAGPLLMDLLHDESNDLRIDVIDALGKMGVKGVWEPLVALLTDAEPAVRCHAAVALARIGWGPQTDEQAAQLAELLLAPLKDGRLTADEITDPSVLAELARKSQDPVMSEQVAHIRSKAVTGIREPNILAQIALDDPQGGVRRTAVRMLHNLKGSDHYLLALKELAQKASDPYVRANAAAHLIVRETLAEFDTGEKQKTEGKARLNATIQNLRDELQQVAERIELLKAEKGEVEADKKNRQSELAKIMNKEKKTLSRLGELAQNLEQVDKNIGQIQSKKSQRSGELAHLEARRTSTENQTVQLNDELESIRMQIKGLNEHIHLCELKRRQVEENLAGEKTKAHSFIEEIEQYEEVREEQWGPRLDPYEKRYYSA